MKLLMAYLMHICFDNDHRLVRDDYLFEYKGIQFKLVQNTRKKWSDTLLSLLQASEPACNTAFAVASEFLSALNVPLTNRAPMMRDFVESWASKQASLKRAPNATKWGSDDRCHRSLFIVSMSFRPAIPGNWPSGRACLRSPIAAMTQRRMLVGTGGNCI